MVFSDQILGFRRFFSAARVAFSSVAVLTLLAACGQKGPLFLAPAPVPASPSSTAGPAASPAAPVSALPTAPAAPASAAR
ncbi:MAG: lipoprotein [Polaromonas sp.]|nr:lipoprotein [Polaromonas sp.]